MGDLTTLSGLELARLIRSREVTPVDAVRSHIERIKKWNPDLNAMVEDDFSAAIKKAQEQTELLATNPQAAEGRRLFGVPFTVKEMLAVTGFKRTAGNIHRNEDRCDFNATVVQRILDEGAILLGTTNVPELGFWFETDNPVYGTTNNPYDFTKTAGGSSGGESAIIACGGSPFGVGSDIGGSIRIPAFFCGIFGHKPTNQSVPFTGHFPYSRQEISHLTSKNYPYTTIGPLARHAEDLILLMELFCKADEWDQVTRKSEWYHKPDLDYRRLKIFTLPDPIFHITRRTDPELQQTVNRAVAHFRDLGATVVEFPQKFFMSAVEMWGAALRSSRSGTFENALTLNQGTDLSKELLGWMWGRNNYSFPALVTVFIERLLIKSENDPSHLVERLQEMKSQLNEMLGENGILLLPPHSRVAPPHRSPYVTPFDFIYTGIFSVLGVPATSVPMGLNKQGLPLGVQLVAPAYQDYLGLLLSAELEKKFGGWIPPKIK